MRFRRATVPSVLLFVLKAVVLYTFVQMAEHKNESPALLAQILMWMLFRLVPRGGRTRGTPVSHLERRGAEGVWIMTLLTTLGTVALTKS